MGSDEEQHAATQTDSPGCCAAALRQVQELQRELFHTRRRLQEALKRPTVSSAATQTQSEVGQSMVFIPNPATKLSSVPGPRLQSSLLGTHEPAMSAAVTGAKDHVVGTCQSSNVPRPDFSTHTKQDTSISSVGENNVTNNSPLHGPTTAGIKQEPESCDDNSDMEDFDPSAEFADSDDFDENAMDLDHASDKISGGTADGPGTEPSTPSSTHSQPTVPAPHPILGPHFCEECNLSFASSSASRCHASHIHSQPWQLQCRRCGSLFEGKKQLLAHQRSCHSDNSPATQCTPQHSSPGQVHCCNHCDRTFKSPGGVRRHINATHVSVPFKCGKCNKAFRQRNLLVLHEKTHASGTSNEDTQTQLEMKQEAMKQEASLSLQNPDGSVSCCPCCGKKVLPTEGVQGHSCNSPLQDRLARQSPARKGLPKRGFKPSPQRRIFCPICGKVFRNVVALQAHAVLAREQNLHE